MKWWAIMYALDSTPRTLRLCLILLVISAPALVLVLR